MMEATLTGPTGRTVLGLDVLTIGRIPDNRLVVTDAKTSSRHAEIRWDGQNYTITDLGSTNGTFVNDQQLERNVSRSLRSGDVIRIGDTLFNYSVTGGSPIGPTVYASSSSANVPSYTPTVAVPPPSAFTAYGQGQEAQAQQGYQPPPPPPAYPNYGAPPPAYPAYGVPPPQPYGQPMGAPGVLGAPGMPNYGTPVASKPNRTGLWIGLGVLAAVIVIGLVVFFVVSANSSSPNKTLDTFCNALQSRDYQTAYNQLSGQAAGTSEADFVSTASSANLTCTHGPTTESGNTATAPITISGIGSTGPVSQPGTVTLTKDSSGNWKIITIR